MSSRRLFISIVLGVGLTVTTLCILNAMSARLYAASGEPLCVSANPASGCHATIQRALDAATEGATINVAQGTYTEPVLITKSITLEGGWNDGFTAQDPEVYVSTIDAQRRGPALRVEGTVAVTVSGFIITGGDDTDGRGQGGGIRVTEAGVVTIHRNIITDNIACATPECLGQGGGIGVFSTTVHIVDNTIISNTAQDSTSVLSDGGGIYIQGAFSSTLVGNEIVQNVAARGGGVYLGSNDRTLVLLQGNFIARNQATAVLPGDTSGGGGILSVAFRPRLVSNEIVSNSAAYSGGGVLLAAGSEYSVENNTIKKNHAPFGGGLFVRSSTGTIARNRISANIATKRGGGLYLYADGVPNVDANLILSNTVTDGEGGGICIRNSSSAVTLSNQIIAHNRAIRDGSGVFVSKASGVTFVNNTVVDNNRGTVKEGAAVAEGSRVTMTNNIFVGHTVAISVSNDSTATLSHNDYWDNLNNVVDDLGPRTGATDLVLDPRFLNRAAGDYHLSPTSPVIDKGDDKVRVFTDFEGDARPHGDGMDIGADEFAEFAYHLYLSLMLKDR